MVWALTCHVVGRTAGLSARRSLARRAADGGDLGVQDWRRSGVSRRGPRGGEAPDSSGA